VTDKIIVFSTCGSAEEARSIGRSLVEAHLAACVNIIAPVLSVYRWQGAIEEAAEWLLVIKTRRELTGKVEEELRRVHSYQVPEILAVQVVDGLRAYLEWIDSETAVETSTE
jgi:periplasmic divalent cation tolerance protein